MANRNLAAAKRAKNDEFYTRLQDVEAQLIHYRPQFENKTVFLNCDDPTHSAFWRHFHKLFAVYGLKKLIATHYEYDENVHSYAMVYEGGSDSNALTGMRIELDGNGDFRSDECVEFLKESDIVVTNPPFSLFREYVAQLMKYDKKFLIIGSKNALTYKEIFPLIQSDSMWLGPQFPGGNAYFYVNPEFVREYALGVYDDTEHMVKFRNVSWFTNLDVKQRHEDLFLSATYYKKDGSVPQASLDRWPHYDNYDAIEVSKVKDIPVDYEGVMGVPITFLDKYNPEQFEIIGASESEGKGFSQGLWVENSGIAQPLVDSERKYKRLFIRARHPHPAGVPVVFDEYE